ncbi:hypothetical protein ACOMHN_020730 [Nucella lapillus]
MDSDWAIHDVDSNVSSRAVTSREPLSDEGYLAIVIYLSVLGVVATAGNVTVLLVILCQRRALRKMQNVLLVNMAAVDLAISVTAYPFTAAASSYKRWIFGDFACQLGGFLVFMLSMVSMDTLTLIAIFRYILVCKPKRHDLLTVKSSKRAVLLSWAHSSLWTVMPLLGWSRYVPEPFLTACSLDWTCPGTASLIYVLTTFLTCYLLHLTIIVFCYFSIWTMSRRLTFGAQNASSCSGEGGEGGGGGVGRGGGGGRRGGGGGGGGGGPVMTMRLEEVLWRHKMETERGVTRMCAVMVTAYLVCWTPYAILSLLATMGGVTLPTTLTTLPTMFAKLSCALNPIIYALMSEKFRRVLLGMIAVWRPKQPPGRNRVATTDIELRDGIGVGTTTTMTPQGQAKGGGVVREYRGDITNQGIYIGNLSQALKAQPSVF